MKLDGFRNLSSSHLSFSPHINWFFGENGSGKTSILEAIYHLGYGRSFRSNEVKKVINFDAKEFILFAKLMSETSDVEEGYQVGLSKHVDGNSSIKVNGEHVASFAELVRLSPIQFFSPNSVDRLLGSPACRRMCLDWLLFHVEHDFGKHTSLLNKVLKQRNSLLRKLKVLGVNDNSKAELAFWDNHLCRVSTDINGYRQLYLSEFVENVFNVVRRFALPVCDLKVEAQQGWPDGDLTLAAYIDDSLQHDIKYGRTKFGAHKFDLIFTVAGRSVFDVWSRGMLRLLTSAVQIALCMTLKKVSDKRAICLVDDFTAELDSASQIKLLDELISSDYQVFITQISSHDGAFSEYYDSTFERKKGKMFHVKQGSITEETT